MKHYLFALISMIALSASAQDVIVKRNGDEVQAKVAKISDSEIEYKKWSNPNGPSYTIKTSDVFMIKYENGEKDVFDAVEKPAEPANSASDVPVLCRDNAYNQEALARFNQFDLKYTGTDTSKDASRALWVFGLTSASVIADENVEISFDMGYFKDKASVLSKALDWEFHRCPLGNSTSNVVREPAIRAIVKNKTSKTIYIDLGNSFICRGDNTQAYYIPESVTNSNSSGVGVSVGIGIVGVGSGASTSSSTTVFSQRVIAIPPRSSKELTPQYLFYDIHKAITLKSNMDSDYKLPGLTFVHMSGARDEAYIGVKSFKRGECWYYSEDRIPFRFTNTIAYSFSEQCTGLTQMNAEMYIRAIVGAGTGKPDKLDQLIPGIASRIAFPVFVCMPKRAELFILPE